MMTYYLIIINIITFFLYMLDKHYAIKKMYRISEYTLLVFSFFGGCFGALCGMQFFHHKTRKGKFWILNILCSFLWLFILYR